MTTNILMLAFLLFSFSCTSKKTKPKESSTFHLTNDILLRDVTEWKNDSLGCLKLRSKENAEIIISLLKKDSIITKQTLYQNLGRPNEEQQDNDDFILIYYFDCLCNDGSLIKDSDKCYARFYLQSDLFKEMDFICE